MAEELFTRPRCVLLGCQLDGPCCHYCGTDLYDAAFIQSGWLEPVFRLGWRIRSIVRRFGPKHCRECGKKYVRGYDEYLCSEECHDNWLPF